MGIDAVIFDFNGVLVDDESVHFSLFSEVLAKEGVELSLDAYLKRYLGYDDRKCFEMVLLDSEKSVDAGYIDRLIAQKARRYTEVASEGLRFFPSVSEATRETISAPMATCDLLRGSPCGNRVLSEIAESARSGRRYHFG